VGFGGGKGEVREVQGELSVSDYLDSCVEAERVIGVTI
jgi:hypothetical protein